MRKSSSVLPLLATLVLAWAGVSLAQNSPGGAFDPGANYTVSGQWTWRRALTPWVIEGNLEDPYETRVTFTEPTADRVITDPDATTTVAGTDATQTLTNKTFDLGSNTLTSTSAQLLAALSDETGTGAAVFGTSPVLTTPFYTVNTENVTAANVIAAAESGRTFFLNAETEFASTLPAPAAGLRFTFLVVAAPSGASYTVITTTSANVIKGQQFVAADAAGDTGTADDTISFVDGQAVAGDRCELWSDGTSWFAHCFSAVAAGLTFTQAS